MDTKRFIDAFRFNKYFWGIICFLLIGNLFFYTVIIGQQQKSIYELQNYYKLKRRVKLNEKNDGENKGYLLARQEIINFKDHLPPKIKFIDVVMELFEALRKHELLVSKMTYKPKNIESENIWKYTTSFTVSGDYARLKGLLATIQNSPTLFCIESLSFLNKLKDKESVEMK